MMKTYVGKSKSMQLFSRSQAPRGTMGHQDPEEGNTPLHLAAEKGADSLNDLKAQPCH